MTIIEIDKRILYNLNFFKENFFIRKFLSNIRDDKLIINKYTSKELTNITRISLLEENEINKDNFNKIKIYFLNKENKEYFQIWKSGRFFKILFNDLLNTYIGDTDLYEFISFVLGLHVFESYIKNLNYKIVIDEKITYYYNTKNYISKGKGSLGHSCMNDKIDSIKFYEAIDKVKIFGIVNSNNKVFGRCLLWETDKGLYLDRCYLIDDTFAVGLVLYAKKYYNVKSSFLEKINSEEREILKVTVDIKKFLQKLKSFTLDVQMEVPYFDTFAYIKFENDKIILTNDTSVSVEGEEKLKEILLKNYIKNFKVEINDADLYELCDLLGLSHSIADVLGNVFNIYELSVYNSKKLLFLGYIVGINILYNENKIDTLWFLVTNLYSIYYYDVDDYDEKYEEYIDNIVCTVIRNINKILEYNNYNNYYIYNQYISNECDVDYHPKSDNISNSTSIAYVTFDVSDYIKFVNEIKRDDYNAFNYMFENFFVSYSFNTNKIILYQLFSRKIEMINKIKPDPRIFGNIKYVEVLSSIDDLKNMKFSNDTLVIFNERFMEMKNNVNDLKKYLK